jgi:hypothetical protein
MTRELIGKDEKFLLKASIGVWEQLSLQDLLSSTLLFTRSPLTHSISHSLINATPKNKSAPPPLVSTLCSGLLHTLTHPYSVQLKRRFFKGDGQPTFFSNPTMFPTRPQQTITISTSTITRHTNLFLPVMHAIYGDLETMNTTYAELPFNEPWSKPQLNLS